MAKVYVCKKLVRHVNVYGSRNCKEWALIDYDNNASNTNSIVSVIYDDLAITRSEMVEIGSSITAVFVLIVCYNVLAKAVKSM